MAYINVGVGRPGSRRVWRTGTIAGEVQTFHVVYNTSRYVKKNPKTGKNEPRALSGLCMITTTSRGQDGLPRVRIAFSRSGITEDYVIFEGAADEETIEAFCLNVGRPSEEEMLEVVYRRLVEEEKSSE